MTPGDEAPLLTFQWRDRDRPLFRLFGYTLLTVVGAAGFFMLFKVVYPQARHFSTAPQQVLVLDSAQPATRDIVNRTRDENFLLLGADLATSEKGGEDAPLFPVFRPGFAGFEMKLMDIPGESDKKSLPRVYSIKDMHLPQIATVMKARPPSVVTPPSPPLALRIVLHGELASREVLGPRDVSGVSLADVATPRFRFCVNDAGLVTFALPVESTTDVKQMRALHRSVSNLRFKRVKSPAVQWGEASFVWENAKP